MRGEKNVWELFCYVSTVLPLFEFFFSPLSDLCRPPWSKVRASDSRCVVVLTSDSTTAAEARGTEGLTPTWTLAKQLDCSHFNPAHSSCHLLSFGLNIVLDSMTKYPGIPRDIPRDDHPSLGGLLHLSGRLLLKQRLLMLPMFVSCPLETLDVRYLAVK